MSPRKSKASTPEDKLDIIIEYLYRLDKRDKMRTWGSFFRSIIGFIPTILFLAGAWYLYYHGDEFLTKIAAEAAEQAARITQESAGGILEQFKGFGL